LDKGVQRPRVLGEFFFEIDRVLADDIASSAWPGLMCSQTRRSRT